MPELLKHLDFWAVVSHQQQAWVFLSRLKTNKKNKCASTRKKLVDLLFAIFFRFIVVWILQNFLCLARYSNTDVSITQVLFHPWNPHLVLSRVWCRCQNSFWSLNRIVIGQNIRKSLRTFSFYVFRAQVTTSLISFAKVPVKVFAFSVSAWC